MTHLAKLNFISVQRTTTRDPIIARRDKLMAGLKEQTCPSSGFLAPIGA
jgi:hypothetical protein